MSDHDSVSPSRRSSRTVSRRDFVTTTAAAGAGLAIVPSQAFRGQLSVEKTTGAGERLTLAYGRPADDFSEALPIGNGRLGAMVYGGVQRDSVSLNHDRLWRRKHRNTTVPVVTHLAQIRRLAAEGKWWQSEQVCLDKLQPYVPELGRTWTKEAGLSPERTLNSFQPAGNLEILVSAASTVADYQRVLDLTTGVTTVRYRIGGVTFSREYFCVETPSCVVVHLTASRRATLNFAVNLHRGRSDGTFRMVPRGRAIVGTGLDPECSLDIKASEAAVLLSGTFVEGVTWSSQAQVITRSGSVREDDNMVTVSDADEAWVITAIAVDLETSDPPAACRAVIERAAADAEQLRARAASEHRSYFDRVQLQLTRRETRDEQTDAWLRRMRATPDGSMYETMFNYGRYLLIASSRPNTLPANLQGVWNEDIQPAWNSDYHFDINLEMAYWPAEVCNLSELADPLLRFADSMVPVGRKSAMDLYGCRGILFPIATDPHTRGAAYPGQWVMWTAAAAWIAQHYWWHWEWSGDEEFLRDRAYPFLKEVGEFYVDFAEWDEMGRLQTVPGLSPEQAVRYVDGDQGAMARTPTMDIAFIRSIFAWLLEASAVLKIDDKERQLWRDMLNAAPDYPIDDAGMLLEYPPEFEPVDPKHRHVSHLIGLFPGDDIVPGVSSPRLVQAARLALEQRGAIGAGGWATLFRAGCWARLGEGDRALDCLDNLVKWQVAPNLLGLIDRWDGVSKGPRPIQLDCNFGISAVIAEMLLQSHAGIIRFIPALPQAWPDGSVKGLRGRGGFDIDVEWTRGRLEQAILHSRLGRRCRIQSAVPLRVQQNGAPVETTALEAQQIELPTRAGAVYRITRASA